MPLWRIFVIVGLAGCAPPSVMLGASFGWAGDRMQDGRALVRTRSALFVRLGVALDRAAGPKDPLEPPTTETRAEPGAPAEPPAPACTLEAACTWERAQVARADQRWRTP